MAVLATLPLPSVLGTACLPIAIYRGVRTVWSSRDSLLIFTERPFYVPTPQHAAPSPRQQLFLRAEGPTSCPAGSPNYKCCHLPRVMSAGQRNFENGRYSTRSRCPFLTFSLFPLWPSLQKGVNVSHHNNVQNHRMRAKLSSPAKTLCRPRVKAPAHPPCLFSCQ